ncbi:MAG: hypothetical protein EOS23_26525 [Mesorhizobium sp.]|nr:MAG: hypothetical protein EOS23_26525 [Mesorhizobium sp.]
MAEIRAIAASRGTDAAKQRRLSTMGDKVVQAISSAGEARRLDGMTEKDAAKWMEAAQLGYDEAFAAARQRLQSGQNSAGVKTLQ